MDERTCETCRHENKTNGQLPCSICETETGNMWEPKDTAEYVQELLEQKYGGYGRKKMKILNAFAEVGMGIIVIFASVATGCFVAGLISDINDKLRRKL